MADAKAMSGEASIPNPALEPIESHGRAVMAKKMQPPDVYETSGPAS
jgi:hypothetical protein